jgi:hypothetical protein
VDAAIGEVDVVSDTVSELTGHEPQTLVDFLRRHPESYQHCSSLNFSAEISKLTSAENFRRDGRRRHPRGS